MRASLAIVVASFAAACAAGAPNGARAPASPGPGATQPPPLAAPSPEPEEHGPDPTYAEPHADEEPDDGEEPAEPDERQLGAAPRAPHPLAGKARAEIAGAFRDDPASLGSISLGRPSAGGLLNGVQMPRDEAWTVMDPAHAWGTRETVDYIASAIRALRSRHPEAHQVYIGHISAKKGGALRPHMSHQSGRDVDLSYFYRDDSARWYRRATEQNLDRERTWAFVRALIVETDAELILIDRGLQKLLREHALGIGEDPAWVAGLFDGIPGALRPLIFHAKGHATHLHVRFYNPVAQETALRAHEVLSAHGYASAATAFVPHRAKNGETLGMLAKKYGTSVREIQLANGLKGTKIRVKHVYRIPKRGPVSRPTAVLIPARRLPPSRPDKSAAR